VIELDGCMHTCDEGEEWRIGMSEGRNYGHDHV
jgi:hypothetical protein